MITKGYSKVNTSENIYAAVADDDDSDDVIWLLR